MRRLAIASGLLVCVAAFLAATTAPTSPTPLDTTGRTQADYNEQITTIKQQLPDTFTILQQPPFIVCGDDTPRRVKYYSEQTVAWAVKTLKNEYFEKDPTDLITIYLFKDEASYKKYTKQLFDEEPSTPYGYYSPTDKALIMNISTGGGTLVHEIVHPFVAANFPKCPAWFNEGLGSLYEQSGAKDGRIVGYTNWRLPALQKALKAATVPSFEKFCATTDNDFYTKDRGTNYGQARYLCYYLQEKGLLQNFYKAFLKNHEKDPTGYETIQNLKKIMP